MRLTGSPAAVAAAPAQVLLSLNVVKLPRLTMMTYDTFLQGSFSGT